MNKEVKSSMESRLETVFIENTKTGTHTNIRPLSTSIQQAVFMAFCLKHKFHRRFTMDTCITYVTCIT